MNYSQTIADIYPSAGGVSAQPAIQQASGNTMPVSPFVTTTWIGILLVMVLIRVLWEIAN